MSISVGTELEAAVEAAQIAGAVMREWRSRGYNVHFKEKGEKVTSADRLASIKIKNSLNSALGPQSMLTEESGYTPGNGRLLWVIDPLDGTENFFEGKKDSSVAIAAVQNSQPIIGVIYNPFTDELYTAMRGKGAFLNGSRIMCSGKEHAKNLTIYAEENADEPLRSALPKLLEKLPIGNIIMLRSSSISEARMAAGAGDVFLKLSIRLWDAAAGHCILRESGCVVTDCLGNPFVYDTKQILRAIAEKKKPRNPMGMFAAPPGIHQELIKLIAKERQNLRV